MSYAPSDTPLGPGRQLLANLQLGTTGTDAEERTRARRRRAASVLTRGALVVAVSLVFSSAAAAAIPCKVTTPIGAGVDDGWQAGPLERDGKFEVQLDGKPCGSLAWDILGRHNQLNALAAIAAARYFGVDPKQALAVLACFRNVKRRLEIVGRVGGILVYDDFAGQRERVPPYFPGGFNVKRPRLRGY